MSLVYRAEDLEKQRPWDILHQLQSDLDYFLTETNSKQIELPKHALDIMLKRVVCELQRAKEKLVAADALIARLEKP